MIYTVYKHTNRITGKSYVGVTKTSMQKRWMRHVALSRTIEGTHCAFQLAIKKYGSGDEVWEHQVLETFATLNEAFDAEKKHILAEGTLSPGGYNMTFGGEGRFGPLSPEALSNLRRVVNSPEYRRKNSEAQKRFWAENPERRDLRAEVTRSIMSREGMKEKVSNRTKEAMQSSEVKEKIAAKMSDPDFLEKHRAAVKKSWEDPIVRQKHADAEMSLLISGKKGNKRVQQIDLNTGEVIAEFLSMREAARKTATPKSSLQSCLRGILKQAGGFLWRYL
jgi:group I intron endonuclease